MKQNFYQLSGSKLAEFITILHIPYLLMCLAFLAIGFGIAGINRIDIFSWTLIAYILGLGISAHAFDQTSRTGTSYVNHLTVHELMLVGVVAVSVAVAVGVMVMIELSAWWLAILIPVQTFFVWAYPRSEFCGGRFHNDGWFVFSFGALPVVIGYYINTLEFSAVIVPWAGLASLIALGEITLSRYVRAMRNDFVFMAKFLTQIDNKHTWKENDFYIIYLQKPELALKLLCLISYLIAMIVIMRL